MTHPGFPGSGTSPYQATSGSAAECGSGGYGVRADFTCQRTPEQKWILAGETWHSYSDSWDGTAYWGAGTYSWSIGPDENGSTQSMAGVSTYYPCVWHFGRTTEDWTYADGQWTLTAKTKHDGIEITVDAEYAGSGQYTTFFAGGQIQGTQS